MAWMREDTEQRFLRFERKENGSQERSHPSEKSRFKGEAKGRVVVVGRYQVQKLWDGFSSFEDGRDVKVFRFCWEGPRGEIWRRK